MGNPAFASSCVTALRTLRQPTGFGVGVCEFALTPARDTLYRGRRTWNRGGSVFPGKACIRACADAVVPTPRGGGKGEAQNARMSKEAANEASSGYPPGFILTRSLVFIGMATMYATYVALRATWTFVAPAAVNPLSLTLYDLGIIASAFPIMYGMSRLVTGIIADRTSPRHALGGGLGLAGFFNLMMSFLSHPTALAATWGMNGLVQGVGAGACAKMLTAWYSRKERGFWWAVWSCSANIGAFIAPIICGYLSTSRFGFRSGLFLPGLFALLFAFVVTPFLRNSPTEASFKVPWSVSTETSSKNTSMRKEQEEDSNKQTTQTINFRTAFVEGVLKNKRIWALAAAYFFVYFIRQGLRSWLHFHFVEAKGYDAASAAIRASGMEIGGVVGNFSAGMVSDALDGRRVAVTIVYLIGLAGSLVLTGLLPQGSGPLFDMVAIGLLGFFINGPQCLLGLIGAEVSDPRVVATANGVLGWISYAGAAASGLPLSLAIRRHGWSSFFIAMTLSSLCAAVILLPMSALKGKPSEETA